MSRLSPEELFAEMEGILGPIQQTEADEIDAIKAGVAATPKAVPHSEAYSAAERFEISTAEILKDQAALSLKAAGVIAA